MTRGERLAYSFGDGLGIGEVPKRLGNRLWIRLGSRLGSRLWDRLGSRLWSRLWGLL